MLNVTGIENGEYLEYKSRPIVRKENEIFFGDLSVYYVKMMILTEKDASKGDEKIPDLVIVQLFAAGKPFPEKQIKEFGLANAFETAEAWLNRYDPLSN